jgi:muconolactone delta-isomerase
MQFISISRRRTDAFPPEAFTPELMARETLRVKELYASGILRQIWKRGDVPGATILWEAASEVEVRVALGSLPIYQALEPYPGFSAA